MSPPLDLDKIRRAARAAQDLNAPPAEHLNPWLCFYAQDVPALLAEIDRLREQLARQETARG